MPNASNGSSGRLAGKTALITGTGSGQGRAAALLFAREGARVVGCDLNLEGAAETVKVVAEAGGEMVSLHPCDLTDPVLMIDAPPRPIRCVHAALTT